MTSETLTEIDALADAIEAAIDSVHDMDVTHADYARASAAAVLELVKPKRLVWVAEDDDYVRAESPFGSYGINVWKSAEKGFVSRIEMDGENYLSIFAAQAVAQSHADAAHWANTKLGDMMLDQP